jgi:hypothetical protein
MSTGCFRPRNTRFESRGGSAFAIRIHQTDRNKVNSSVPVTL